MLIVYFLIFAIALLANVHGYFRPICTYSMRGLYPYPGDCRKYYECLKNRVTIYECSRGLSFNPLRGECDWSEYVKGCENGNRNSAVVVCPKNFVGQVPHPQDCQKFVQCYHGVTYGLICNHDLVYNIETSQCDFKENVPGCYGEYGNGVNFRTDLTFSPLESGRQNSHSTNQSPLIGDIYAGYKPRETCRSSGCTPSFGKEPKPIPSLPRGPLPPLESPPITFFSESDAIKTTDERNVTIKTDTTSAEFIAEPKYEGTIPSVNTEAEIAIENSKNEQNNQQYAEEDGNEQVTEISTTEAIYTVIPTVNNDLEHAKNDKVLTNNTNKTENLNKFEENVDLATGNTNNDEVVAKNENVDIKFNNIYEDPETATEYSTITDIPSSDNADLQYIAEDKAEEEILTDNIDDEVNNQTTIQRIVETTTASSVEQYKTEVVTEKTKIEIVTPNSMSDETKLTTKNYVPKNEGRSTSSDLWIKVAVVTEAPEEHLKVIGIKEPRGSPKPTRIKYAFYELPGNVNRDANQFQSSEIQTGRSADSSYSWNNKFWPSHQNMIQNSQGMKEKQNKSGNSSRKDSKVSVSPVKSDNNNSIYMIINGTKYHYIINKKVEINQNHSKVRSYNKGPTANARKEIIKTPMRVNDKAIDMDDSDVELSNSQETELPFPLHYIPPIYFRGNVRNIGIIPPKSGQSLRLRGGIDINHGYVEVQGDQPGWGSICHTEDNWTLQEATIICRQLGYQRGANMAWKGRMNEIDIPLWIATSNVQCQGNETQFQTCKFQDNSECNVQRDAVGVRCLLDNQTHCSENEVFYRGYCYYLVESDSSINHQQASENCVARNSSLLYITKQKENDFLSEWFIQRHPTVDTIIISGMGFPAVNRSHWIWKGSQKTKSSVFTFSKWWPGWDNEIAQSPVVKSSPLCAVMKRKFPCTSEGQTTCDADYFFWDTQSCISPAKASAYVCKRLSDNYRS